MNRGHKKLDVWRESVSLATHLYQVTEKFPKTEIYVLTSQMRRAVVSIPSNIAEGAARASSKEFAQFLNIAGGSLSKLDTQIESFAQRQISVMEKFSPMISPSVCRGWEVTVMTEKPSHHTSGREVW